MEDADYCSPFEFQEGDANDIDVHNGVPSNIISTSGQMWELGISETL
jgi:hypothetical protein